MIPTYFEFFYYRTTDIHLKKKTFSSSVRDSLEGAHSLESLECRFTARHEALMRQPSDDIPTNHITMQMQPGYVLGEKVIRPAQVGVAE